MPQPGRGRERQVQWRGGGVASNIIGRNCAVGGKDGRANRVNKFVPSFIALCFAGIFTSIATTTHFSTTFPFQMGHQITRNYRKVTLGSNYAAAV